MLLTCEDKLSVLHGRAPRPDGQVYAAGVHVPLVRGGVKGGRGATVVPQPHVVQVQRRPPVVQHCRFQTTGLAASSNPRRDTRTVGKLTQTVVLELEGG